MGQEEPVTSGFTETISISDGIFLEHRKGGELVAHRLVSDQKEINLLTKEVRFKKEEKHGM